MNTNFVVCKTESDVSSLTESLQGSSTLILDCEGSTLGVKSGHLSLIGLGSVGWDEEHTYIIDVRAIGKEGLKSIFDLLESSEYGATLRNVVDLQLANIKSRRLRGESGTEEQLSRLSPYLNEVDVSGDRLALQIRKTALVWSDSQQTGENFLHAANNIRIVACLWTHFEQAGYIDEIFPEQSLRYVGMWVSDQPKLGDGYRLHPLLPLTVLDGPGDHTTRQCIGCKGEFGPDCFSKAAWSGPEKRRCFVCRAIGIRLNRERQIEETRDSEYDSDDSGGFSVYDWN
ncbi:hypothetical protein B0H16DRAFT_1720942 [Mycena metata]|uniref:3'-5' exonuclease domain-containing protein n=1 Tax=Mycena metata TaxID=1033252 RepID=A0AAD7NF46_9AGAR|nr:hypothetical protein B0H16DRAFT_1720942 [Mycena metata]